MKVKTLIKKLQKLDPNADIYSRPIISGLFPPGIIKKEMVKVKHSVRTQWETTNIFEGRPKTGKYSAKELYRKTFYFIE